MFIGLPVTIIGLFSKFNSPDAVSMINAISSKPSIGNASFNVPRKPVFGFATVPPTSSMTTFAVIMGE